MKKSNQAYIASLSVVLIIGCGSPDNKSQDNTKENEPINPVGIKFNTETLKRLGSAITVVRRNVNHELLGFII